MKFRKLLCVLCLAANAIVTANEDGVSFEETFSSNVVDMVASVSHLPGLPPEVLHVLKPALINQWQTLEQAHAIEVFGPDEQIRPLYVSLQAILENVLAHGIGESIQNVTAVFHTPLPATPLCAAGSVDDLVDPSIADDPLRLFTVKARCLTVNNLLNKGAMIYSAYPEMALTLRSDEQQQAYFDNVDHYNNLIDCPLLCDGLPETVVGALYFIQDYNNHLYVFAIQMAQSYSVPESGYYGLWFGSLQDADVRARVNDVLSFLLPRVQDISSLPLPELLQFALGTEQDS